MTRVCMVAFTHYAVDQRVRREAELLVDRGDVVDFICLRGEGEPKARMLNGVRLKQLSIGRYRGSNPFIYLFKYLLFFFSASFHLIAMHLRVSYDLVQVHTMPDFMVFVAFIPKLLGVKVLLDVHDLMPELYQSKFGLSQKHRLIRFITWIERQSIRFANRAIAVHKPHLHILVKHGNPIEKFDILMNLPDPKTFSGSFKANPANNGQFKLVYHGTVSRRHGLHIMLRAIPTIREEIAGFKMEIFGDGDDIPYLVNLTRELGLQDCVSIHQGMVPMENLVPTLLTAKIGVVPMLNNNFTRHTLPVKLMEYVALGIPVVSSRIESLETYFDNSMIQYFEPGDVDDLAEKVLELYRSPNKREVQINNAYRFIQKYSWEQQKIRYYHLVDDLVGKRSNKS